MREVRRMQDGSRQQVQQGSVCVSCGAAAAAAAAGVMMTRLKGKHVVCLQHHNMLFMLLMNYIGYCKDQHCTSALRCVSQQLVPVACSACAAAAMSLVSPCVAHSRACRLPGSCFGAHVSGLQQLSAVWR